MTSALNEKNFMGASSTIRLAILISITRKENAPPPQPNSITLKKKPAKRKDNPIIFAVWELAANHFSMG